MQTKLPALLIYAGVVGLLYGVGAWLEIELLTFHSVLELDSQRLHVETGSMLPFILAFPVLFAAEYAIKRLRPNRRYQ